MPVTYPRPPPRFLMVSYLTFDLHFLVVSYLTFDLYRTGPAMGLEESPGDLLSKPVSHTADRTNEGLAMSTSKALSSLPHSPACTKSSVILASRGWVP